MSEERVDIRETGEEVAQKFSEAFSALPRISTIYDKSIKEWMEYFNVPVGDPHNADSLRIKLGIISDRSDECSDIISAIRVTLSKLDLEDFLTTAESRRVSASLRKKLTEAERQVARDTLVVNAIKKLAHVYLKPFEEQQNKLKNKRESIKSLLMSVGNQRNNERYMGPTEDNHQIMT